MSSVGRVVDGRQYRVAPGADPHFTQFAGSLMALLKKYEPLLKNKVQMSASQRESHLLAVQREQLTSLLAAEREFRDLLIDARVARDVYGKFVKYIRDERRNILVARPFFRERQQVFTARVSPALDRRDIDELTGFSFNATFVQFALRCRRWTEATEAVLAKFPWWRPLKGRRPTKAIKNEARMVELVTAIFAMRNTIVECNLPLVVDWASKFYRKTPISHLTRMDMVNIATEGLIAAIDKLELSAVDQDTAKTYPWQGDGDADEIVFIKEPGSVFRSVGIGRMTGNLIEHYSGTLMHFWPKDRRKLYRANKNRAKMETAVNGERAPLWTGIDGIDFDKLAEVVNTDEKSGELVGAPHRTDAIEIADLIAASSCVSPIDEEGNDQMASFAADDEWRPDGRFEKVEIQERLKAAIQKLSLVERKLLALSGIDCE